MNEPESDKIISGIKTRWLVGVLSLSVIYATIRYIVFKGVPVEHFPLYILNKASSISGIFFLAMSYANSKIDLLRLGNEELRKLFSRFAGLMGLSLAGIHTVISIIILNPAYFPKFFDGNVMNLKGEAAIFAGVLGLYLFILPGIAAMPGYKQFSGMIKWQKKQRAGYWGLFAILLHTSIMGFQGWWDVKGWPGYMPPITLLGAIIAFIPLFLKLKRP